MKIKSLVILSCFFISSALYAQKTSSFPKGWSLGVNFGSTQFKGDIRQYNHFPAKQNESPGLDNSFRELRSAISFSLNKRFNSLYSLSGELITGSFAGLRRDARYSSYSIYDPYNLYEGGGDRFVTSFTELDLLLGINLSKGLIGDVFKLNNCKKWTLSAKAGFGINVSNTLRTNIFSQSYIYSTGYDEQEYFNSGLLEKRPFLDQLKETVYIYGLKAAYDINPKFDILIDYTVRNGVTDFWDASPMNTENISDRFTFLSLGIAYKFGKHNYKKEDVSPLDILKRNAAKTLVKIDLLIQDSDNDGVADAFDKDPNTPLDVAVDGSGRAIDIDMDNIPDYRDADPFSRMGAQVDSKGIGLDDDKDGVPNSKDLEANTPEGVMVNQFGINIKDADISSSIVYFPPVYFTSGSIIVGSSNKYRVATIASILKNNTDIRLNVIGHTDKVGTLKFNEELGLQRANAVIDYLVLNYNIDANRMIAKTKGENEPLSTSIKFFNNSEKGSEDDHLAEINRRVNFELID